jgi:hypothetical protein
MIRQKIGELFVHNGLKSVVGFRIRQDMLQFVAEHLEAYSLCVEMGKLRRLLVKGRRAARFQARDVADLIL